MLYAAAFFLAFYNIFKGQYDTSKYFSPYMVMWETIQIRALQAFFDSLLIVSSNFPKWRMPFDESTPTGFIISLILQSAAGYTFMLVLMSVILYYLGHYLYVVAFIEDFQWLFDKIDNSHTQSRVLRHFLIDTLNMHVALSE